MLGCLKSWKKILFQLSTGVREDRLNSGSGWMHSPGEGLAPGKWWWFDETFLQIHDTPCKHTLAQKSLNWLVENFPNSLEPIAQLAEIGRSNILFHQIVQKLFFPKFRLFFRKNRRNFFGDLKQFVKNFMTFCGSNNDFSSVCFLILRVENIPRIGCSYFL